MAALLARPSLPIVPPAVILGEARPAGRPRDPTAAAPDPKGFRREPSLGEGECAGSAMIDASDLESRKPHTFSRAKFNRPCLS